MSPKTDLIARLEFTAERSCVSSAADLRAAAAAVRLVAECREALIIPSGLGGLSHREDEHEVCYDWCPACKQYNALAAIAEWEGEHGQ